jgi:hypothetical protein
MPVLYVGDNTAMKINSGHESGYVIALVPGEVDLEATRIWFGEPDLPERVDAQTIEAQHERARKAGIEPVGKKTARQARTRGGEPIKAENLHAFLRDEVADLIMKYSPQERELAESFRTPVIKPREP